MMLRILRRKDNTGTMTKVVNAPLSTVWNLSSNAGRGLQRPALMVTWAMGENFGGMTAMCLKRASIFASQGTPCTVVTFDFAPDLRSQVASAVASGKLSPRVPVANLYEYYAQRPGEPRPANFKPTNTDEFQWVRSGEIRPSSGSGIYCLEFEDAETRQLRRREYFRADGTPFLFDSQLPPRTPTGAVQRILQLIGTDGGPAREFNTTGKLYRRWLSELVGDLKVDVIIDSKFAAGFLWRWEHPGSTKSAVLHSTHVKAGHDLMTGTLNRNQQGIIDHRDAWDRMVLLTHGQAAAFGARLGDNSNIGVISNPVDGPATYPSWKRRDRYKLLYIGRLTPNKNVDKVIAILSDLVKTGLPATLDIIGDGPKHEELVTLVEQLGLQQHVHFTGYVSDVPRRLEEAGAVLLCSDFEGQPLALLEAKAHGCVPVSFDIDFGPRDVISPGISGILTDFDDIEGMASAIGSILRDEDAHAAMSRTAFQEATAYAGPMIYKEWKRELSAALDTALFWKRIAAASFAVDSLTFSQDHGLQLAIRGMKVPDEAQIHLLLRGRDAPVGSFTEDILPSKQEAAAWTFDIHPSARDSFPSEKPVDFHVGLSLGMAHRLVRLGLKDPTGLLPILTGYDNLSFR